MNERDNLNKDNISRICDIIINPISSNIILNLLDEYSNKDSQIHAKARG